MTGERAPLTLVATNSRGEEKTLTVTPAGPAGPVRDYRVELDDGRHFTATGVRARDCWELALAVLRVICALEDSATGDVSLLPKGVEVPSSQDSAPAAGSQKPALFKRARPSPEALRAATNALLAEQARARENASKPPMTFREWQAETKETR